MTEENEKLKFIDPICGMMVAPETAAGSLEHDGESVYFCSQGCLEKYKKKIKPRKLHSMILVKTKFARASRSRNCDGNRHGCSNRIGRHHASQRRFAQHLKSKKIKRSNDEKHQAEFIFRLYL